jgi:hypothetical protein
MNLADIKNAFWVLIASVKQLTQTAQQPEIACRGMKPHVNPPDTTAAALRLHLTEMHTHPRRRH